MINNKPTLEQFKDPQFRREMMMKDKQLATWLTFTELGGLINSAKFSEIYFERTPAWFKQKLNGNIVNGKKARFNAEEYDKVAASLRDLAKRLSDYADAIDAASID